MAMRTLRYLRLSAFEKRIAFQSFLALAVTYVGLRLFGFRLWKKVVTGLTPAPREQAHGGTLAAMCATIVRMHCAAERRLFFRPNCLDRALVLWWQLRRHGVAADLRLGARKEKGRFEAHAWVEFEGAPLCDPVSTRSDFIPFAGPAELMESHRR
jgi:hypothetical protein